MSLIIYIYIIAISFISNFVSALIGGGAGLIQLPALLFLNLPFPEALVIHKIASVFLGLGASIRYTRDIKLYPELGLSLSTFGVFGVIVGSNYIIDVDIQYSKLFLFIITSFVAILSFIDFSNLEECKKISFNFNKLFICSIYFFIIGFLNGSLSSGSGLFVTIFLVRFLKISFKSAIVHTIFFVGIIWNLTGALVVSSQMPINWLMLFPLIIGSYFGGNSGAVYSLKKSENFVRIVFSLSATIMALVLLIK